MSTRAACSTIGLIALLGAACSRPAPGPARGEPTPDRSAVAIARAEARRAAGVEALVAYARGNRHAARLRAIRGLGRTANPAAVTALEALLGDRDPVIRRHAALALAVAGQTRSETPLADAYGSADAETRAVIVTALGRVGGPGSLPLLTAALGEPQLAESAALALGWFGRRQIALDEAARGALTAAVRSDASSPAVRYAVAFALSREHEPRADGDVARALHRLAHDRDAETRATAIRASAQRGAASALAMAALDDPDWRVQVEAIRGLSRAAASADERRAIASATVRAWTSLRESGFTGPRIHVVLEGLRGLAAGAELPEVRQVADTLHAGAGAILDRPEDHGAALAASTVHCLTAGLRVRSGAPAAELLSCGGPVERGMPEHERRAIAAEIAAQRLTGDQATRVALLTSLAGHADSRVRAAAIRAIGDALLTRTERDSEREALVTLLAAGVVDPSVETAGAAAEVLVRMAGSDDPQARVVASAHAAELVALASREPGNIELTITALSALAESQSQAGAALCQTAHRHSNRSVRAAARACLTSLSGQDPGPGSAAGAARLPPVDPATVIGRQATLTITTDRGDIEIALDSDTAPWHAAAIAHLAGRGFYRDLLWHRVVANFVIQGGDPLGSGWGGPDFEIPAEPWHHGFHRGTVGIADAGLDTGGSQWFIMHARAPHLDARYTRIGQVVRGQSVVDSLIVGDRIRSAAVSIR